MTGKFLPFLVVPGTIDGSFGKGRGLDKLAGFGMGGRQCIEATGVAEFRLLAGPQR